MLKTVLAAVTIGVAAANLSSCGGAVSSSQTSLPSPSPSPPANLVTVGSRHYSLVNEFGLHDKTLSQLNNDAFAATTACMKSAGLVYKQPTDVIASPSYATVNDYWHYSTTHGYGIADQNKQLALTPTSDPNYAYVATLSAADQSRYWLDLTGMPSPPSQDSLSIPGSLPPSAPGCENQALRTVLGPLPFFQKEVGDYINGLPETSAPVMQEPVTKWSQCMAARGYPVSKYDDEQRKLEASHVPSDTQGIAAFQTTEVATATADAYCYITDIYSPLRELDAAELNKLAQTFPQYSGAIASIVAQP